MRFVPSLTVCILVLATASAVLGQTPPPPAEGDATKGVKTREWVQKGSQKVVEINFDEASADVFYGKVQKPGVDYLITQGDLAYEGLPMDHDLLQVLEQSVKGPPF
jgi:hypothetical protein